MTDPAALARPLSPVRCRTPARVAAQGRDARTWWLAGSGGDKQELWAEMEETREEITGLMRTGAPAEVAKAKAHYRELEAAWVELTLGEGGKTAAAARPPNAVAESTSKELVLAASPKAKVKAVQADPFAAAALKRRPFTPQDISQQPSALARPMTSPAAHHRDALRTLPMTDAELKRLYTRLTDGGTAPYTWGHFMALLRDVDPCGQEEFSQAQHARWAKAHGLRDGDALSCQQFCALALRFHTCF